MPNPADANTLGKRLAQALEGLRADDAQTLDALPPLYDEAVTFRDPIQEIQGLDRFMEMNRRLLGRARTLSFGVLGMQESDDTIFIEWTMRCTPKIGPKMSVDGVTRAQVREGRVIHHRDYWDLGEFFTSPLPGGVKLLHFLLKPLS